MAERWICRRCYTSADESVTTCPNCGLARGEAAPSAFAFTPVPEGEDDQEAAGDEPQKSGDRADDTPVPTAAQPEVVWHPPYVPLNAPEPTTVEGPPAACGKCGSPLFAQWWSPSKSGYECRRCGAVTKGAPPSYAQRGTSGCFFGCAAIIAVMAVLAVIGGEFGGGVGMIAVAALIAMVPVYRSRTRP